MKSNEELYQFIFELRGELEARNETALSTSLDNALHLSSVGTEIFMALRRELTQLLDSHIHFSQETRGRIEESISDIGRALR